jgi:hypothetical protein
MRFLVRFGGVASMVEIDATTKVVERGERLSRREFVNGLLG